NPSIPILDVRLKQDVEATGGRLNRAIPMPMDSLLLHVHELDRFRDTTLVVLGKNAEDGGQACQLLSLRGFKYVVFVSDGAEGWFRTALPPMSAAPALPTPTPEPPDK